MKINSNNIRIKIQITIKLKAYFRNDIIEIKTVDLKIKISCMVVLVPDKIIKPTHYN